MKDPQEVSAQWQADAWVAQFIAHPQPLAPLEFEYLPLVEETVELDADFTRAFDAIEDQMERVRRLLQQVERGTMGTDPSSETI